MEPKKQTSLKQQTSRKKKFTRNISKTVLPRSFSEEKKTTDTPKIRLPKRSKSDELPTYLSTQQFSPALSGIPEEDARIVNPNQQDVIMLCFYDLTEDTINTRYSYGDTPLIYAARKNSSIFIENFLTFTTIDVNAQNYYQNTALHYIAKNNNKDLIKAFMKDPRVDMSKTNNKGEIAHDYVKNSNTNPLRQKMFARTMLDWIVNAQCKDIETEYAALTLEEIQKQDILNNAIVTIKTAFENDHIRQKGDRALPESSKLPDYISDSFIGKMILHRLIALRGTENKAVTPHHHDEF